MARIARIRDVATSTASAGFHTFAPLRVRAAMPDGPAASARTLVSLPSTALGGARRLVGALGLVPALIVEAAATLDAVAVLVRRLNTACADIEVTVAGAQQLELRVAALLADLEPLVAAVADLDNEVPARAAALLSRSGPLLDRVDTVLMPLLDELHDAVPDVRAILPVVQRLEPVMVDFETRIAGLPGSARMRRRGEQVIEDAQAENDNDGDEPGDADRASS